LALAPALAQLLPVAQRRERADIEPALEPVVHFVEERAATDSKHRVPCGETTNGIDADDFHRAGADAHEAELHVVLESLADGEWNHSPGVVQLRRCPQLCGEDARKGKKKRE